MPGTLIGAVVVPLALAVAEALPLEDFFDSSDRRSMDLFKAFAPSVRPPDDCALRLSPSTCIADADDELLLLLLLGDEGTLTGQRHCSAKDCPL